MPLLRLGASCINRFPLTTRPIPSRVEDGSCSHCNMYHRSISFDSKANSIPSCAGHGNTKPQSRFPCINRFPLTPRPIPSRVEHSGHGDTKPQSRFPWPHCTCPALCCALARGGMASALVLWRFWLLFSAGMVFNENKDHCILVVFLWSLGIFSLCSSIQRSQTYPKYTF